jgi:branched-chain amino acid transport system substrate-binding protein
MTLPLHTWHRRQTLRLAAASTWCTLPAWAQGSGDIRIGQSTHLSGPLAATTVLSLQGQDLAFDEVNRAGGIGGQPIRLIKLDDMYDPARCLDNTRRLVHEHQVTALFGLANSAGIAAALPMLAQTRVPLIGVYTGTPALREKHHPYFFTTGASFRDEVVQMVRTLVTLQQHRVGLAYQNNAFGALMAPVVAEVAQAHGATLVAQQALEVNGSNAPACAQALAGQRAQAVLMMAFGPSTVSFVRAARKHLGVPVYGLSVANISAHLKELGEEARGLSITQTVPYPWRETTPLARDFHAAIRRAKLAPSYELMRGYLNARVLIEGLKRAGKKPTGESLTRAMQGMSRVDLGGYELNYSPTNHHGARFVEITIVGTGGRILR